MDNMKTPGYINTNEIISLFNVDLGYVKEEPPSPDEQFMNYAGKFI